jgi:hypothetical protein
MRSYRGATLANCLAALDEGENPRFDMLWQVATLIKEWAQYIVPLQFYILW